MGSRLAHRRAMDRHLSPPNQPDPASNVPAHPDAPACADAYNAGSLVGQNGCVKGMVFHVYTSRTGNTFLDFCQDFRTCPFSSVIFTSDKSKFGDLESLVGRHVEIRGRVVPYEGHAEIIVRDPQQIRGGP